MIKKSNSVPNFLFETPKARNYTMKLNFPKIIPYSEFIKNNPMQLRMKDKMLSKIFMIIYYAWDNRYQSGLSLFLFQDAIICFSGDI